MKQLATRSNSVQLHHLLNSDEFPSKWNSVVLKNIVEIKTWIISETDEENGNWNGRKDEKVKHYIEWHGYYISMYVK